MPKREPINYTLLNLKTAEDVLAADIPEDARRDFLDAIELRDANLGIDQDMAASCVWSVLKYLKERAVQDGIPLGVLVKSMRARDVIGIFRQVKASEL